MDSINQNKIVRATRLLSSKERNRFGIFLESPYFNKNQKVIRFWKWLNENIDKLEQLTTTNAFTASHDSAKYNHQQLKDIMSYTYRLWLQFLSVEKEHPVKELLTLNSLARKGDEGLFNSVVKKFNSRSKGVTADEEFLLDYQLLDIQTSFAASKAIRHASSEITELDQKFNRYFILSKLKLACHIENQKYIVKGDYIIPFMEEISETLREQPSILTNNPAIEIYFTIWRMLTTQSETYYEKTLQLVENNQDSFVQEELLDLYAYLQNFCIRKINQSETLYNRKLFQLYQKMLHNNILVSKGEIHQWNFKNIVTIGCRIGEYKWVEEFIESYQQYLDPIERENIYHYSLASLYYEQRNLKAAMHLLLTIEFTDSFYNLGARSMLLKIYFEEEETEALLAHIKSFRMFLDRNSTISKTQYQGHLSLLLCAGQLYRLQLKLPYLPKGKAQTELQKVQTKIEKTRQMANKEWLLQRLEECREHISPL